MAAPGDLQVRALVFDVFGTLLDWRSAVVRALVAAGLGPDPEQLADSWRVASFEVLGEISRGERAWADFDGALLVSMERVLGERVSELDAAARRALVAAWHQLEPWPDVREGLVALRRDRVVATLSNGHIAMLVDLARHAGLHFDCLLSSELAGAYKPSRRVYQAGARLLAVAPENLMLVAAHPEDLAGGRRVGLRTAFVDRPLEHGPGSPPREDPDADLSVRDLGELVERLAAAR